MPINYGTDVMNGAQLALRAAGISDERMRTQLLQKFQESQMATQELQRQNILAQMTQRETQNKLLQMPVPLTPRMRTVPLPPYTSGQGMPPFAPGATTQEVIPGKFDVQMPEGGINYQQAMMLEKAKELFEGDKAQTLNEAQILSTPGPARDAYIQAKLLMQQGKPEKPINMPPWYDSLAMEKMGSKYNTPEGQKTFSDWVADPKNQKEISAYRIRYATENATPFYSFPVTAEGGILPANARQGTIGQPSGYNKPLTSEMVTFEGQYKQIKDGLKAVRELYDPKYVGPIDSTTGLLREKITGGLSENQALFYAKLAEIKNVIVYLYSGKQINENEMKRLMESLPTRFLPDSTFQARLKGFDQTLDSINQGRTSGMGGYGKPQREGQIINPQKADWMNRARKVNPGISDTELETQWNKKQGAK